MTTELLGLCSPGVGNEECSVVRYEPLLQLHGAVRIDVLRVVRNDSLCDRLADGVDLGSVSTTLYADTDVDGGEGFLASLEDGLVDLEAEDLRLKEVDGGTVDVDETTTLLGVRDRSGRLYTQHTFRSTDRGSLEVYDTNLLFAESLDSLYCRSHFVK